MTFEPPAPSLQQQHHPQSNKKKSFKVTQKSNLNYLHLPLFAPEAKLNPFFYVFHALWCVRLFTADWKYRISRKFAILKTFIATFLV